MPERQTSLGQSKIGNRAQAQAQSAVSTGAVSTGEAKANEVGARTGLVSPKSKVIKKKDKVSFISKGLKFHR